MDSAEERQQLPGLIIFRKNQGPMAEVGRVVTV